MHQPAPPPAEGALPHAITFFVSAEQRRLILAALRAFDKDRVRALCLALGVRSEACST